MSRLWQSIFAFISKQRLLVRKRGVLPPPKTDTVPPPKTRAATVDCGRRRSPRPPRGRRRRSAAATATTTAIAAPAIAALVLFYWHPSCTLRALAAPLLFECACCGVGRRVPRRGVHRGTGSVTSKSRNCLFSNYFRKTPRFWATSFSGPGSGGLSSVKCPT